MHILITGAAGFIGTHLALSLLSQGHSVVGFDNLNDYYDPLLKADRLKVIGKNKNFSFVKGGIENKDELHSLFRKERFTHVINMAAQAGVRYSLQNPYVYAESNLIGFLNLLEACREFPVKHLVFASSSSVYGLNRKMPFSTKDTTDHPVSLYAATKKSGEVMAHSYSHLFSIPCTGLRFFTVYGPWGRPDMALFSFTQNILDEKPINLFNNGDMLRDFTYIDDIVNGVIGSLNNPPIKNPNWDALTPTPEHSSAPFALYNIGNNRPVKLEHFVNVLEEALGKKAIKNYMEMQDGDVKETYADIEALKSAVGFEPKTEIEVGIPLFVDWYKKYFKI